MKSTIFNRLFMTSLFICFIIQTGYSKSNYGIIMCDSVVANRANVATQYNETFLNDNELTELW